MSRRKSSWLDDLAAKIVTSIGDPSFSAERKASVTGLLKSSLELAHRQGVDEGIQQAQKALAVK